MSATHKPLKAKKKLIGVLQVVNRSDGNAFTAEDTLLLRIFANQAAMAIENARLYAELEDRLEQEIDMQNRLAESEKFRALGQMASGIAHDFNNVLMGIQGNISLRPHKYSIASDFGWQHFGSLEAIRPGFGSSFSDGRVFRNKYEY